MPANSTYKSYTTYMSYWFMEKHTLIVQKRTITGKKVKNLRKQGLLPGNIYGKGVTSTAVEVNIKEFEKLFSKIGETGLVYLELAGESHPVLIHQVQLSPTTDLPLHADFYQVNLKEKVTSQVPIELVGEAEAVVNKIGVLLTLLDEVEVEALPTDLPEHLELNITSLKEIDEELKVKDLKVDKEKVEIKSDSEQTIVKIGSLVTEEMKKEAAAEAAAKAAAAATATPSEGAVPEGAKPTEAGKADASPVASTKGEAKKPEAPKKEEGKKK